MSRINIKIEQAVHGITLVETVKTRSNKSHMPVRPQNPRQPDMPIRYLLVIHRNAIVTPTTL
jgi:hypothetical protein